ncbi:hypothetical protein [Algivirga pacifica]|uniref:Uncharacterized protein n=1 Tax=Algivirga pacifica TaxID=1162670 RepID=A0ABP9D0E6_9BACT
MKRYIITLLALLSTRITLAQEKWQVVDYGDFTVELPVESKNEALSSPDSYASKIIVDSTVFFFDYGYYSPKMTLSVKEYIEEKEWVIPDFLFLYFDEDNPLLLKVDSLSKYVYKAHFDITPWIENDSSYYKKHPETFEGKCEIDSNILSVEIIIPDIIQKTEFYVTEADSTFKRIFIPHKGEGRKSGTYMIDFSSCTGYRWCSKQLSFWAEKRGDLSDKDMLKIYQSLKLK